MQATLRFRLCHPGLSSMALPDNRGALLFGQCKMGVPGLSRGRDGTAQSAGEGGRPGLRRASQPLMHHPVQLAWGAGTWGRPDE